ncbi:tyrosine-type recombinase/integrase [Hoeflea sp.]|uniref:tyrosine-type recombinase/integrase n=1 Tax=Hoeflea sp. TaxID=1940281 RepID=UPI003748A0E1
MPLELKPPRPGKSPYWTVRGTHLGVKLDRSTKATDRVTAAKVRNLWKSEIERGLFAAKGEMTFLDAAVTYMAATGNEDHMEPLVERLGHYPLSAITQQLIDETAIALKPDASPATRNRWIYTPVSAVLKHAGHATQLKRPKGWRGSPRVDWMKPDQAFRLIDAARAQDPEFAIFLSFLLYTGARLGEALKLKVDRVALDEASCYIETSKNGDPYTAYMPPALVAAMANHPRGWDRSGEKAFRFTKCGRLYTILGRAKKAAGPDLDFVTFHTFRHTWATWMRRYGKLDTRGLLGTERWRDAASVRRYEHVDASEEARRADHLPTQGVENAWKTSK